MTRGSFLEGCTALDLKRRLLRLEKTSPLARRIREGYKIEGWITWDLNPFPGGRLPQCGLHGKLRRDLGHHIPPST